MPHDEQEDEALFSRTASTSPYGKCTEQVRAMLPFEIKESFARLAHSEGMTESEFLRDMIMIKVLGVSGVQKIHEDRLMRVARNVHESTQYNLKA